MVKTKKTTRRIIDICLIFLAVIWLVPMVFALISSVKSRQEYNMGNFWDLPKGISLAENIEYIESSADIFGAMGSSLLYAASGAVFSAVLATLAAYAIAHLDIKHKMFWFLSIYCGTIFPFQIYLIPVYKGMSVLNLYDTRLGMILFYTAISIPFSMFVLRNFFIGISRDVIESAKIDGATDFKILLKILLPMAKAPLSVVLLSQFTWIWNELMFGITFTKDTAIRPEMAAISLMGRKNIPALMLACIIASIPTFVLYMTLQKNFEQGLAYQSK